MEKQYSGNDVKDVAVIYKNLFEISTLLDNSKDNEEEFSYYKKEIEFKINDFYKKYPLLANQEFKKSLEGLIHEYNLNIDRNH